ncbi:MAG: hypothetical protein JWM93_4006 [Frankiales bacterium]|nr:hypothetical protein [Frankiales bacterium]
MSHAARPPDRVVFAAISTTGPSIAAHDVWEISLIERRGDGSEHEHNFFIPPAHLAAADPAALHSSQFHERTSTIVDRRDADLTPKRTVAWTASRTAAEKVARHTAAAHIVASAIAFTAGMLDHFLRVNLQAPSWQQPVDVDVLVAGHLAGRRSVAGTELHGLPPLPWRAEELAVAPPRPVEGIARARWIRDLYDYVTGVAR